MVGFGADVVLFGIQAGVRLIGQARQAYVDRTRERPITLVLPGMDHAPNVAVARNFFRGTKRGKEIRAGSPRIQQLHDLISKAGGVTKFETDFPEEAQAYIDFFVLHDETFEGKPEDVDVEEFVALNTIAQWRAGTTPHPSSFRRIAGTLVEIGVDYFATGPGRGKLAGKSASKALVRDVLGALDDHSFVDAGVEGVIEKVFVASLESVAENPQLVSGDAKTRMFVAATAKGLVADVQERIAGLPKGERLFQGDRLGDVAGMVFKSVVRSGAGVVLAHPGTFFREVDETGEAVLVQRVGTTILDVVLGEEAVFTAETLDVVVAAALGVVAEHPEVLGLEEEALRTILGEIAGGLAKEPSFAELARLVLERTGENLHLFWRAGAGTAENLAVVAVRALLDELAAKRPGAKWRPRLSQSQLLDVVEAVLDELADNPRLVLTEVDDNPVVQDVIRTVLTELARRELDTFSGDTVAGILKAAVHAGAERWAIVEMLPGSTRTALASVLDAIFAAAADPASDDAAWTLAKGNVVVALVEVSLETLAEEGVTKEHLAALRKVLDETKTDLAQGRFSIEDFAIRLALELEDDR